MLHVVWLVDKFYILWSCADDRSVNANKIELNWIEFIEHILPCLAMYGEFGKLEQAATVTCLLAFVWNDGKKHKNRIQDRVPWLRFKLGTSQIQIDILLLC
jgi:hypothetical protein